MLNLNGLSTNKAGPSHVKVLILGAGPAGLSAAIQLERYGIDYIIIEKNKAGGLLLNAEKVENYPGFPEGVGGSELGDLFQKQAERFGARIEIDSAQSVDFSSRPFKITTDSGIYTSDSVIIATGANPNHLNIPRENELVGRGVSYCGTCDGWFFKGKKVAVVGGGDSALEEGLFLTRFATNVTIIHRRGSLRAGALLQKRAVENPKVQFLWNTAVTGIVGNEKVEALQLKNNESGEKNTLEINGLFIFIGHTPNTQMFAEQVEMKNGYIKVDERFHTNIPGVYAAGEVADPRFKQVITSAGMGAAAAIEATHFLEQESN